MQLRPFVAVALGALAICCVMMIPSDPTEEMLVSTDRMQTVVERSCFVKECVQNAGEAETCTVNHHECHPLQIDRSSRSPFMPRFTAERVVPRDSWDMNDDSSDFFNEWRMPRMRMPRMHMRWVPEFIGARKIKVQRSKKKKSHALKVVAGPAAHLSKKKLAKLKAYRKKIAAARKKFLKSVAKARKGLGNMGKTPIMKKAPVRRIRVRIAGAPAAPQGNACYEKQCVSQGGPLQCKLIKLKCGGTAAGPLPFQHMARMLHRMLGGRARRNVGRWQHARRPVVHVVRIKPIAAKPMKLTKKMKKKLEHAFHAKNMKAVKKAMKKKLLKIVPALKKKLESVAKAAKKMAKAKAIAKKARTKAKMAPSKSMKKTKKAKKTKAKKTKAKKTKKKAAKKKA